VRAAVSSFASAQIQLRPLRSRWPCSRTASAERRISGWLRRWPSSCCGSCTVIVAGNSKPAARAASVCSRLSIANSRPEARSGPAKAQPGSRLTLPHSQTAVSSSGISTCLLNAASLRNCCSSCCRAARAPGKSDSGAGITCRRTWRLCANALGVPRRVNATTVNPASTRLQTHSGAANASAKPISTTVEGESACMRVTGADRSTRLHGIETDRAEQAASVVAQADAVLHEHMLAERQREWQQQRVGRCSEG
jgi:hypothetical protein